VLPSGYNTCNGQTIAAGSSCSVYVEFAPGSAGYLTGTLTFDNSTGTAFAGAPVVPLAGFAAAAGVHLIHRSNRFKLHSSAGRRHYVCLFSCDAVQHG